MSVDCNNLQPNSHLRRKQRLSFATSDLDNPTQAEILYQQCKEQVLNGTHPVSRDTAICLAAVQCFIDHGPYKSGVENYIKAQDLLPKEYSRAREHEKNILHEYKNLICETTAVAKRRYCELCKSLPTYGVTFFIVKERLSATEKKLVTRLFGVSKDCVMCVDRKSKLVLKSWPLEQLRRWAASSTTFNIDFGDYTEGYYSVQTLEGEVIKKLIGEYVDIILKKSQIVDPKGIEGDEGGIMLEDHIASGKALPFAVEDGHVIWHQNVDTFYNENNAENFPQLIDIAMQENYFPQNDCLITPLRDGRVENKGAFIPIQQKTEQYQQHLQYPNQQGYNQQQTPLGKIKTTITTQEISYSNGNRPRIIHYPPHYQQRQIINHNQQQENLMCENVPGQSSVEPIECQSNNLTTVAAIGNSNINEFPQFIKIANDIPNNEIHSHSNGEFQNKTEFSIQQHNFDGIPQQQYQKHQIQCGVRNIPIQQGSAIERNDSQISKNKTTIVPIAPAPYQHYQQQHYQQRPQHQQHDVSHYIIGADLNPIRPQRQNVIEARITTTYQPHATNQQQSERENLLQIENSDAAIRMNLETVDEARLWLTPESILELCDLPKIVAAGADAANQLNWLVAIGTHAVSQHLGNFVVMVAQIIELTSNYTTQKPTFALITSAISSSGIVLADLVACIRELSALLVNVSEPVASKLLYKTHKLCGVFGLFMEQLYSKSNAKRASILSAASLVGETTCALLSTTSCDDPENVDDNAQAFYDILNERIQNIASSTANVVLQAKTVPIAAEQKGHLFYCATQIAFTASELIALSRVLTSVLSSHSTSQQRVAEAVQRVANAINEMVVEAGVQFSNLQTVTQSNEQRKKYDQLLSTANFANNALHQFLTQIQQSSLKSRVK